MSEEFLLSTTEEVPHGWNKELDEGQGCRGALGPPITPVSGTL